MPDLDQGRSLDCSGCRPDLDSILPDRVWLRSLDYRARPLFPEPQEHQGRAPRTLSFTGGRVAVPSFIRRFDKERIDAGVGRVRDFEDIAGGNWTGCCVCTLTGEVVLAFTIGWDVG